MVLYGSEATSKCRVELVQRNTDASVIWSLVCPLHSHDSYPEPPVNLSAWALPKWKEKEKNAESLLIYKKRVESSRVHQCIESHQGHLLHSPINEANAPRNLTRKPNISSLHHKPASRERRNRGPPCTAVLMSGLRNIDSGPRSGRHQEERSRGFFFFEPKTPVVAL